MRRSLTFKVTLHPNELKYNIVTVGNVSAEDLNSAVTNLVNAEFVGNLMDYFQSGKMGPWRISTIQYKVEE